MARRPSPARPTSSDPTPTPTTLPTAAPSPRGARREAELAEGARVLPTKTRVDGDRPARLRRRRLFPAQPLLSPPLPLARRVDAGRQHRLAILRRAAPPARLQPDRARA